MTDSTADMRNTNPFYFLAEIGLVFAGIIAMIALFEYLQSHMSGYLALLLTILCGTGICVVAGKLYERFNN